MKCLIFLLFYNALDLNNQKILCLPSIYEFERTGTNLNHPTYEAARCFVKPKNTAAKLISTLFTIPSFSLLSTISMKHEIKELKINDGQMMLNRLPIPQGRRKVT